MKKILSAIFIFLCVSANGFGDGVDVPQLPSFTNKAKEDLKASFTNLYDYELYTTISHTSDLEKIGYFHLENGAFSLSKMESIESMSCGGKPKKSLEITGNKAIAFDVDARKLISYNFSQEQLEKLATKFPGALPYEILQRANITESSKEDNSDNSYIFQITIDDWFLVILKYELLSNDAKKGYALSYYEKVFDEEFSWIAGPSEKIFPKVYIDPQGDFFTRKSIPTSARGHFIESYNREGNEIKAFDISPYRNQLAEFRTWYAGFWADPEVYFKLQRNQMVTKCGGIKTTYEPVKERAISFALNEKSPELLYHFTQEQIERLGALYIETSFDEILKKAKAEGISEETKNEKNEVTEDRWAFAITIDDWFLVKLIYKVNFAHSKSWLSYYEKVLDEEFSWIAGPDETIYPKVTIRPEYLRETPMPD